MEAHFRRPGEPPPLRRPPAAVRRANEGLDAGRSLSYIPARAPARIPLRRGYRAREMSEAKSGKGSKAKTASASKAKSTSTGDKSEAKSGAGSTPAKSADAKPAEDAKPEGAKESGKPESAKESGKPESAAEGGKSAREAIGGKADVHYGYFSSVRTPAYRSGWDAIWGGRKGDGAAEGEKTPRGRAPRRAARARKRRDPITLTLDLDALPPSLREGLVEIARAELRKSRVSYERRDKAGAVDWRITCRVG